MAGGILSPPGEHIGAVCSEVFGQLDLCMPGFGRCGEELGSGCRWVWVIGRVMSLGLYGDNMF